MQVDSIKPSLKAPEPKRLKLKCDELLSNFAFNLNLRRYIEDGVVPLKRRDPSSHFKGVSWHKGRGKWQVKCKGKSLGDHATEEAAARAYNIEAERIGRVDFNVIPPANGGEAGDDAADPAALALLSLAATARTHASAGTKRAGAPTTPAPPRTKKMRLDASAGAVAGRADTGRSGAHCRGVRRPL